MKICEISKIFKINSNIPKNRSSRCISNTLWFLLRETQSDLVTDFFYTKVLLDCVFPIPIERKSVQNISINNFQLNQPNSIT